ncbi:MAG: zinc-dependent alcohol dehydrogenase [Pseudomonadota bacterium]|nr:zinc-dependent alcohol dehydrogenase [Pseudomonadota bacterium]
MKAVVYHGIGDIRLDDVPEPTLEEPTDAIVRLTASAICGTDLHFIRGTFADMQEGLILGHEGVGVIEALGADVRNLSVGDRVVIPSTIACGTCSYCRAGYHAQCDNANPNGKQAGTSFFGGPKPTGSFNGLQAEKARIPFANIGLVKLPDAISDDQAIAMSDIFPTGYFGAESAEISDGDSVAVFGCGPVGLFAIASAFLFGASRVFAIDGHQDRLDKARELGAETIDYERESPVETLQRLTGGIGADRAIDAVGVDAEHAHHGEAAERSDVAEQEREADEAAPQTNPSGDTWRPGDAPSQALQWAVEGLAKAGTLSIIGVYPPDFRHFPIGMAMNRSLTLHMGNCHHRNYIPKLIELTLAGKIDPARILTQHESMPDTLSAFEAFDRREEGWIKVALQPQSGT